MDLPYSPKLGIATGIALGVGLIASYALPMVTASNEFSTDTYKMGEIGLVLQFAGKDWVSKLFWAGIAAAVICAFIPMASQAGKHALVSLGCLVSLYLPVVLIRHLDGASVGAGLIVLIIALAVAAILPWIPVWDDGPITSPILAEEPAWMKKQA